MEKSHSLSVSASEGEGTKPHSKSMTMDQEITDF